MTVVVDDLSPDGVVYVGAPGLGVPANQVPADGEDGPSYLYDQVVALGLTTEEVYGEIVVWPTTGTFFAWEDGSFEHLGGSGNDGFSHQLYVDGVLTGSPIAHTLDWDGAQSNQAPTSDDNAFTVAEDSSGNVVPTLTGADSDGTVASFRITALPSNGTLFVNGSPATVGQVVALALAGTLTYTPTPDYFGADSFAYAAIDNEGAEDATPATVSITVTDVPEPNVPPTTDDKAFSCDQDTADNVVPTLTGADSDGTLQGFIIASLPAHGTLELADVALTEFQGVGIADAGNLTYTPDAGYFGADSFTYTALDDDGDIDATVATVTITVDQVVVTNAPPVADDKSMALDSDSGPTVIPALSGTDTDGSVESFRIASLPRNGTLRLGGTAVQEDDVVSAAQVGQLTYEPGEFTDFYLTKLAAAVQGAAAAYARFDQGLFQDAEGTIPVATYGDPIGLAIDRSQGITMGEAFGPELVTNGDGEALGTWAGARGNESLSVVNGRIRATSTNGLVMGAVQEITGLTVGQSYYLSLKGFNGADTETIFLRWQDSPNLNGTDSVAVATGGDEADFSGPVIATSTTMYVGAILSSPEIGEYIELDNVTLRRVIPISERATGLGPDLVTNGDFSNGSADWGLGAGWSVSGGVAIHDGTSDSNVSQNGVLEDGKFYLATVVVSSVPTGSVRLRNAFGSVTVFAMSAPGTYEIVFQAQGTRLDIRAEGNTGDVSISSLSARELPGNHFTPSTLTSRPLDARVPVGGRRNLFSSTHDLTNTTHWTVNRASVSANEDGSTRLTQTTNDFDGQVTASVAIAASEQGTITIEAKQGTQRYLFIREFLVDGGANSTWFDLQTGAAGAADTSHSPVISSVGDGWYRCSVSFTNNGTPRTANVGFFVSDESGNTVADADDIGKYIDIRKPQYEIGGAATSYQRVASDADITEDGVASLEGLLFDGVDDFLVTPSIDLSGTDEATLALASAFNNLGSTSWFVGDNAESTSTINIAGLSNGATRVTAGASAAPVLDESDVPYDSPNVRIARASVPLPLLQVRSRNDSLAEEQQRAASMGSGNFGNKPLILGARRQTGSGNAEGYIFAVLLAPDYVSDTAATTVTDEGVDSFLYHAIDDDGAESLQPGVVSITVTGAAPNVGPDTNSLNLAVFLNAVGAQVPSLSGTDTDGTIVSYRIASLPSNGTLRLSGVPVTLDQVVPASDAGDLSYVPNTDYTGADSFTYAATDDDGAEDATVATVSINVFEPVASGGDAYQALTARPMMARPLVARALVAR